MAYRNREVQRQAQKKYYEDNKDKVSEKVRKWRENDPKRRERQLLYAARHRAKKRGLEFSISLEDISIPECCPVLGMKLEFGTGRVPLDQSPTLDRIDNSKGYINGNVHVISNKANRIKGDSTPEELTAVARYFNG